MLAVMPSSQAALASSALDGNALAFSVMQILWKRRPDASENRASLSPWMLFPATAGALLGVLTGCASPGAPQPPSLKLAAPVTDLTATRVAGQVVLRWTTPTRTTDRMLIAGPLTAEICREPVDSAARAAAPVAAPVKRTARPGGTPMCIVVQRVQVSPGASQAADPLSPALTSGTPGVLAYRVQLLNSSGRTAGPSAAVYAASGAAPERITGLRAASTKPGVVLEWTHATQPGESVELERTLEQPAPGAADPAKTPKPKAKKSGDLLSSETGTETEARFSAKDTGGAIDRTAEAGATYHYTVQRVRQVPFGGKTLDIRSETSQPVELKVQSVFPPNTATALVAAPAFSPEGKPSIDLSWEPNVELRIAGYKVYRRLDGDWQLLTQQPVKVAAYTDTAVTAGQRYQYRVTAVNDTGMESQPSPETAETAPTR